MRILEWSTVFAGDTPTACAGEGLMSAFRFAVMGNVLRLLLLLPILLLVAPLSPALGLDPFSSFSTGRGAIFVNSGQSLGGETGNGVALGDLDGDGDVDALVVNEATYFGEANQIWFNNGSGFFSAGPTLGTDSGSAVALGDLDDDGDLDAVITAAFGGETGVWINQGGSQGGNEGDFVAGEVLEEWGNHGVALGDLDGDGDLDAVTVESSYQLWMNNGNATFVDGLTINGPFSRGVAVADLDSDGWLDIVVGDGGDGSASHVYWNDANWTPGPGSFTVSEALPAGGLVNAVAVGHLDNDGRLDIFLAGSGPEQIYWNAGARQFDAATPLSVSDNSWAVALAHVDDDGLLDAVTGNSHAEPNLVWRNAGDRSFLVEQLFGDEIGNYWAKGMGAADLNGDGTADLFEVTTADDRVWVNTGTPQAGSDVEGWQVQLVDVIGKKGFHVSLVLDAQGYPHMGYTSVRTVVVDSLLGELADEYTIHYARWDGIRWHIETVDRLLDAFETLSLALDEEGHPHLVYTYDWQENVRYARRDGEQWHRTDLLELGDDVEHLSLALDSDGHPHLLYQSSELMYAASDGAAWAVEEVDSERVQGSSLALDSTDRPHVSFFDHEEQLTYAYKDGAGWHREAVWNSAAAIYRAESSIVIDEQDSPHIGYMSDASMADSISYAFREAGLWQSLVVAVTEEARFETVAFDLDASGNAHLFYPLVGPEGTIYHYARWDGTAWRFEDLDYNGKTTLYSNEESFVSLAVTADGRVHAGYYDGGYADLRYVSWATAWQLRSLPEEGSVMLPSLAVGSPIAGGANPQIAYYQQGEQQVRLASWDEGWEVNPLTAISQPVTALSLAKGPQYEHVSFYDADQQRLMYGYWDGEAWHPEVVDEAGDVGRYNALVLVGDDRRPHVAYWDATSRRIKLAVARTDSLLWDIYPNMAGPPLDSTSGSLSATLLPGNAIGVAYHDGANGDLRLAIWEPSSGEWSDEAVAATGADAGQLNSLQADGSEGVPVVAYLEQGAIHFAYQVGDLWHTEEVPGSGEAGVSSLALQLGLNSRQRARIAYITETGELRVASLNEGIWDTEVVASDDVSFLGEVSAARDNRLLLAYTHSENNLQYAFRSATLDVATHLSETPDFLDGVYNPLDACAAIFDLFVDPRVEKGRGTPAGHDDALDEPTLFAELRQLFQATPEGAAYIDLYRQHGSEMGLLGLSDPALLWDAYGTLQNFLPGLEALVSGHGEEVVVTQEMVDDALSVWNRLADVASPDLAALIQSRLKAHDNLQDFVGLSFDEWAEQIGVAPPLEALHLPLVHAP